MFAERPDHIEHYLVNVRKGAWFGWTNSKNKIYANLIVHDGGYKPTETECTEGLAALQAAWDLEFDSYKSQRRAEFPSIESQLDIMFHSGFQAWKDEIQKIKDKYPKP